MSKPREVYIMEFRWRDGTVTLTPVEKNHPDGVLFREVTPSDEALMELRDQAGKTEGTDNG